MCGPSTCSIEISVMGSHGRGLVVFTPLFCTPQFRGISVLPRFEPYQFIDAAELSPESRAFAGHLSSSKRERVRVYVCMALT